VYTHSSTASLPRPRSPVPACPAQELSPDQRQRLAVDALAGTQPITRLAEEHDVSRKFVYQQADKAHQALDQAFTPIRDDQRVLFYLPVTKALLRQIVLGLVLICHSSFRAAVEFLRDLFDYPLSVGTVANIVHAAVGPAQAHNQGQELSAVRVGVHDEIYQAGQPVLVGACAHSTYCYLLSQEEECDTDTWAVRLWELQERGLDPEATVGDGGTALRAGQELAMPGVPCRGDVFHILYDWGQVLRQLESLAYAALTKRLDLERQLATPGKRRDQHKRSLQARLRLARAAEAKAVTLYDDLTLLRRWLREDLLALAGPDYATRRALFDFVVAEVQARVPLGPPGLKELGQSLPFQRATLLAFVKPLDEALATLAARAHVPEFLVRELLWVQTRSQKSTRRWQRDAVLRRQLRWRYHALRVAVAKVARQVVRASSVAENLNSRLRCYFFLRRQLGPDYLSLLQFFLNHRRFQRSAHAERVGQSPAELLTGQAHPHWLELLGYQRFQRA
jgi:hypothetical protein